MDRFFFLTLMSHEGDSRLLVNARNVAFVETVNSVRSGESTRITFINHEWRLVLEPLDVVRDLMKGELPRQWQSQENAKTAATRSSEAEGEPAASTARS